MITIGVLALQGAVSEHRHLLQQNGVRTLEIKKAEQLEEVDGLIIPGGESTTMLKLIKQYQFLEPLKMFKKPVFGTCAGLILMAKKVNGITDQHLSYIDMDVERNAFGRQRESFEANLDVKDIGSNIHAVFIRAPLVKMVAPNVKVLAEIDGEIVAVQQEQYMACSFHPELTNDDRFHQAFIQIIASRKMNV
ncbi:pyridoxal 5'-phosphate synthase glutaminase subunit PdxT [Alkalihalobacillus pseudalcaliphilus]|uniref:pyridoxal 5'-phosphate synthase glutaminase subunit PdxT n=1 Tax=Alkalihalobacillus pseudalcaliphilus TaxID=79884 RepID=UPI00064DB9E8|nr:pyridoxal 5'-phosphate synthase glutaminase subunit PdxT [Alkalihalobacillus pseudalcaliphilus]KMK76228.1 glutamine amidotransferase [Alkalihalobacillus pseudalcaliphilus]